MTKFCGFSDELRDFFGYLRFDNTIGKQEENLKRYRALISEPLTALYDELMPAALEVCAKLDARPARCISTPYTDRRFSHDVPLKGYMYIRFRRSDSENDRAGLYFDMSDDYYSYGMRIYKQTAGGMEKLREKAAAKPKAFEKALSALEKDGFTLSAKALRPTVTPK